MRGKRAVGLLAICFFVMVVLAGAEAAEWRRKNPVPYVDRVMGIPVVRDTDFLSGKERLACEQNPGVLYEGISLPFDKDGTLYLSQDMEKEWLGELSASLESGFLCAGEDAYWKRKQDAIRENHAFTLWLVGEDYYYEMRLVASGLPVVSILTARSQEPEPVAYEVDPDKMFYGSEMLYYGAIDVFNPGVNTQGYEILRSCVCYHQKGVTSARLEKKSYSISLQNDKEQNVDVSLLGMREDNSWKLNALFNDPNRIREITASRIWEQFDEAEGTVNQAGPKMEYVELILDNRYEGIYCLVEPVDEKKLQLDQDDALYKIINGGVPTDEAIQESADNGWKLQYPIRLRYPKSNVDYEAAWHPMRDYLDKFYREREISYEDMAGKISLANLSDMLMFIMVTSASDNSYNNIYYAARTDGAGGYVMHLAPWDLDLTFGNRVDFDAHNFRMFDADYKRVYSLGTYEVLLAANPEEVGEYICNRWKRYRDGFLGTESVLKILTENRDNLVETGAAIREQERWPEELVEMDIEELLEFQRRRMEWLDAFFETAVFSPVESGFREDGLN